eukprot:scaffold876_cov108-Skeletonema_marinoi.AAC.5
MNLQSTLVSDNFDDRRLALEDKQTQTASRGERVAPSEIITQQHRLMMIVSSRRKTHQGSI